MRCYLAILLGAVSFLASVFGDCCQGDDPEQPRPASEAEAIVIAAAEERYAADIARVNAQASKAAQLAAESRLKIYRDELVRVTKSGDFDKAVGVKERIKQLESELPFAAGPTMPPKDLLRFGGHRYALFREPATWGVAQRRCEEMGGHLISLESPGETEWFKNLCRKNQVPCWIGASDEEAEGDWRWVDGRKVSVNFMGSVKIDNQHKSEHWLVFSLTDGQLHDTSGRQAYVCEWDD